MLVILGRRNKNKRNRAVDSSVALNFQWSIKMIQDEYNHLDNVRQVNAFMEHHKISQGGFFESQVSVEDNRGTILFADSCQCYIAYNQKANRYEIQIYWTYSKEILKRKKLKGIYNSRNYKITFDDSNLVIEIDKRFIAIKFGNT